MVLLLFRFFLLLFSSLNPRATNYLFHKTGWSAYNELLIKIYLPLFFFPQHITNSGNIINSQTFIVF